MLIREPADCATAGSSPSRPGRVPIRVIWVARDGAADRAGLKEAAMDEHFVWMTTRRIRPGTLTDFERAWRPDTRPEGMLNAYAYLSLIHI